VNFGLPCWAGTVFLPPSRNKPPTRRTPWTKVCKVGTSFCLLVWHSLLRTLCLPSDTLAVRCGGVFFPFSFFFASSFTFRHYGPRLGGDWSSGPFLAEHFSRSRSRLGTGANLLSFSPELDRTTSSSGPPFTSFGVLVKKLFDRPPPFWDSPALLPTQHGTPLLVSCLRQGRIPIK